MTGWKTWQVAIVVFLAGVIFTAVGFWVTSEPSGKPILLTPGVAPLIKVQVDGAVLHPGVYSLTPGSRVEDAVLAAGGLTGNATKELINLVKVVEDGERITVPSQQETLKLNAGLLLDLNRATLAELDDLPGIGETRAKKILEYRETEGFFTSVDDLLKVPGITESVFIEIRDLVTIR
jgi:competence protein ComEA